MILIVEDNETVVKGVVYALEKRGYQPVVKADATSAYEWLGANNPELAIVDISLPDGDGFTLFETCLKKKQIPTLFLTARDEEDDIVKGLELGAEDYVTKPFSVRELMVRVDKMKARRNQNTIIRIRDIEFDMDKMVVYKNRQMIELTNLELKILHLLFCRRNKVVKRDDIIEKIWEWTGNDVYDNTVTVYMKRIRQKIGTELIETVKGIGYRIDEK